MTFKEKFELWNKNGKPQPIIQLQWRYQCNFKCSFCSIKNFQQKSKQKRLTLSEISNIYNQFDEIGIATTTITGGEPLLFKDLENLIKAIDPTKFYIVLDTNGWTLDYKKAEWLKSIGVQKIQLSIDNYYPDIHDKLRNKKGSWYRCISAIDNCKKVGLYLIISTVADKKRLWSYEFLQFLELMKMKDVGTYVSFAKPLGANGDMTDFITEKDEQRIEELQNYYNVFSHLDSPYFSKLKGCPALKRIVSMDCYGNIMICPGLQNVIGNIRNNKLENIIKNANIKLIKNGCIAARC